MSKKEQKWEDEQGDVLSFRKNDKLVLAWKDKNTVMIVSTFHSGSKK
jgi:hypothetical protein